MTVQSIFGPMTEGCVCVRLAVMGDDVAWTLSDLQRELERFEAEARRAGLKQTSVRTYVDRSAIFVRWLAGDFRFRART